MTPDPAAIETILAAITGVLTGLGVSAVFIARLLLLVRRFRAVWDAMSRAIEDHKLAAEKQGPAEAQRVRNLTNRIAREMQEAGKPAEDFHRAQLAAAGLNTSPILGAVLRGEAPQA